MPKTKIGKQNFCYLDVSRKVVKKMFSSPFCLKNGKNNFFLPLYSFFLLFFLPLFCMDIQTQEKGFFSNEYMFLSYYFLEG